MVIIEDITMRFTEIITHQQLSYIQIQKAIFENDLLSAAIDISLTLKGLKSKHLALRNDIKNIYETARAFNKEIIELIDDIFTSPDNFTDARYLFMANEKLSEYTQIFIKKFQNITLPKLYFQKSCDSIDDIYKENVVIDIAIIDYDLVSSTELLNRKGITGEEIDTFHRIIRQGLGFIAKKYHGLLLYPEGDRQIFAIPYNIDVHEKLMDNVCEAFKAAVEMLAFFRAINFSQKISHCLLQPIRIYVDHIPNYRHRFGKDAKMLQKEVSAALSIGDSSEFKNQHNVIGINSLIVDSIQLNRRVDEKKMTKNISVKIPKKDIEATVTVLSPICCQDIQAHIECRKKANNLNFTAFEINI